MRAFCLRFGYVEAIRHYSSDSIARRVAARWTRRFWTRLLAKTPAGSIAHSTLTDDPMVEVYRLPLGRSGPGVIGHGRWALISKFAPECANEQAR